LHIFRHAGPPQRVAIHFGNKPTGTHGQVASRVEVVRTFFRLESQFFVNMCIRFYGKSLKKKHICQSYFF